MGKVCLVTLIPFKKSVNQKSSHFVFCYLVLDECFSMLMQVFIFTKLIR